MEEKKMLDSDKLKSEEVWIQNSEDGKNILVIDDTTIYEISGSCMQNLKAAYESGSKDTKEYKEE